MFLEIQLMLSSSSTSTTTSTSNDFEIRRNAAVDLYLKTLRSWGPVSSLKERIKIYSQPFLSSSSLSLRDPTTADERDEVRTNRETICTESELALSLRVTQSAANYLDYAGSSTTATAPAFTGSYSAVNSMQHPAGITFDALFDISAVMEGLTSFSMTPPRRRSGGIGGGGTEGRRFASRVPLLPVRTVALQAIAELHFMKGDYEEALRAYLTINLGRDDAEEDILSRIETMAVDSVYDKKTRSSLSIGGDNHDGDERNGALVGCAIAGADLEQYGHVLAMIESHQMHTLLLHEEFLVQSSSSSPTPTNNVLSEDIHTNTIITNPVIALICLVGLDLTGRFLVEHCTLPKSGSTLRHSSSTTTIQSAHTSASSHPSPPPPPSSALPIDLLAARFQSRPGLLHWFLDLVFREKPEVYVKFPNTAVPPKTVTDLHRLHFGLHVEFDPDRRRSVRTTVVVVGRVGRVVMV